jgi:hypothetical protein
MRTYIIPFLTSANIAEAIKEYTDIVLAINSNYMQAVLLQLNTSVRIVTCKSTKVMRKILLQQKPHGLRCKSYQHTDIFVTI